MPDSVVIEEIKGNYQEVVGMLGVNVFFALSLVDAFLKRFNSGERTKELYEEIMGVN